MKTVKFMGGEFVEWFEETFRLDSHYYDVIVSHIEYAKEHLSEEKIPGFLASVLPDVTEEEIAKFLKTEIVNLPAGYAWKHYEDGSGSIIGPNGTTYFSYDRQPYANVGAVEYKRDDNTSWSVYWDGFATFKRFAESEIRSMERKILKKDIVDDYNRHDTEFSTSYLAFLSTQSLLDAVELYADLQYQLNHDYVYLVRKIDDDDVSIGTICSFDTVFSSDEFIPGKTFAELLKIAEGKAKEAGMMLLRFDWVDTDGIDSDGCTILNGELLDFLL